MSSSSKLTPSGSKGLLTGRGRAASRDGAAFVDVRSGALFSGVTIAVRCDGVDLGQVVADVPREDVAQIKNCTGNVGFVFRPPQHLCDGRDHVWDFISVTSGSRLHNSPRLARGPALAGDLQTRGGRPGAWSNGDQKVGRPSGASKPYFPHRASLWPSTTLGLGITIAICVLDWPRRVPSLPSQDLPRSSQSSALSTSRALRISARR